MICLLVAEQQQEVATMQQQQETKQLTKNQQEARFAAQHMWQEVQSKQQEWIQEMVG